MVKIKRMTNNSPPLVSVLMPTYNGEKYLKEAIESILNQTYKNFEFLIADDCSTDDSWKIIQTYQERDMRIKSFRNDKNLQQAETRNKLYDFTNKSSKYFAIMDHDDISLKNRLEEQIKFLEKKENKHVGVVGSNLLMIDENSKKIGEREYSEKITTKTILTKSPIAHPSAMIRREVIEKLGNMIVKFDVAADFDLCCRVFEFYEIKNIQKKLLKYRISKTQQKYTRLKTTLYLTLKIQWIYFKKYWSFKLISVMLFETLLLILPKKTTIHLFKLITFKK